LEDVQQNIDIWPDTVSVLPLVVGILLAILAWYVWRRQWRFIRDSIKTTGQLIGYESRVDRESDSGYTQIYAPIIRYTALDGSIREFVDSMALSKKRYALGDPIRIRYLQQADEASVDSFFALYGAQLICTLLAVGFIFVAFFPD
jgi:hypothetical protein